MENRIALITGATSGIGRATAHALAKQGFKLILCGRREDRLITEKAVLAKMTEVEITAFDVRDQDAVKKAIHALPEAWKKIDVLVNNAGNAHGLDPIQTGDVRDWDAMIDINVKGLLYVTKEIVPGMIERKSGHIINLGSIAGKEVYPNGNVYCASKFAVDALTRGMRMDLNPYGIKVTSINPGLVETEFSLVRFKGDEERASAVYKGLDPLTGDDIADVIVYVLTRPDHVVLADITVFPKAQGSSTLVNRTV
ncbi:MAG: SDR family NAD(P)-dependent oxidoreductase [Cyclobacteriaceae bacterium]|jgi:NADP-dependent 3-hydroxy acid dehydrogenase YdfG|nr:SDR family NAD(P)-dependent oxidoreductase [Cyclobacteriaceae bacterium]